MEEIKTAILIGESKLISVPGRTLNLWHCYSCGGMFNALKELDKKIIKCPCCSNKISLVTECKDN